MKYRQVWLKRATSQGIPYGTHYRGYVPTDDAGNLIIDADGFVDFRNIKSSGQTTKVKATQILFTRPG